MAQNPNHILGPVGNWKDPSPSLLHQGEAAGGEKRYQVIIKETGKSIMEKSAVMAVILDETRKVAAIG